MLDLNVEYIFGKFAKVAVTKPPPTGEMNSSYNYLSLRDISDAISLYLVRISEIGRYFSWLLLCDRACPVQPSAFFLSRVLLLGYGKLLSIEKKCNCCFVVMCVGFTTNCQSKERSKSLPPDIHPLLFYMPRSTQQH